MTPFRASSDDDPERLVAKLVDQIFVLPHAARDQLGRADVRAVVRSDGRQRRSARRPRRAGAGRGARRPRRPPLPARRRRSRRRRCDRRCGRRRASARRPSRSPRSRSASSGIPASRASCACAASIRYSPWIGITARGRTSESSVRISSEQAWPETCTGAISWCRTSAPCRASRLIESWTRSSFPGTGLAEMITVSPRSTETFCVVAVRDPGQRRHRLALAARAEHQHAVARKVHRLLRRDDRVVGKLDVAEVPRDVHVLPHRAADDRDLCARSRSRPRRPAGCDGCSRRTRRR